MESGHLRLAWRFTLAIIGVAVALTMAVIPVADRPGPAIAGLVPFFVAGVLAAAMATSFLLFMQFREARAWSLLLLAGAYLHQGAVAVAHLLTFPGALLADRALVGTSQSPAWVFMFWLGGYAALSFAAILAEIRFKDREAAAGTTLPAIAAMIAAVLAIDIGFSALAVFGSDHLPLLLVGTRWTALNYVFSFSSIGLAVCGVALILAVERRNTLFLWLALTLAAFVCGNMLAAAGGGRFTVGWITGRLTWVISSGVLFLYFMARFLQQQRALADARDALRARVADRTAELHRSDARLRNAIEAAPFPLMLHASDGEVLAVSEAWTGLSGYSREELRTRYDWTRRAYPDNFAEVDAFVDQQFRIAKAAATGERKIRAKDGSTRVWDFTNIPLGMLPDGRPLTLTATMDVTKRKQDEARQRLLAREVDHRAKNMLAVLQVMLRHTRADTVRDYAEAVQGRVAALARTHTLLAQSRWEGADLKALIEEEVAPYRKGESKRARMEGPVLALGPAAAQSIAMAVHELATNAAKYGALSAAQGRVAIEWRVNDGAQLELLWQESDGPPVSPPTRQGLGTSVIQRSIRDQLTGAVRFDWHAHGLHCAIAIPVAELGHEARAERDLQAGV